MSRAFHRKSREGSGEHTDFLVSEGRSGLIAWACFGLLAQWRMDEWMDEKVEGCANRVVGRCGRKGEVGDGEDDGEDGDEVRVQQVVCRAESKGACPCPLTSRGTFFFFCYR
jgi:hypothetical protein